MTYRVEALKENYHSLYGAVTESRFVYVTEGLNFWTQKNPAYKNKYENKTLKNGSIALIVCVKLTATLPNEMFVNKFPSV